MEKVLKKVDIGLYELVVGGEVRMIIKATMKEALEALLRLVRK